MLNIEAIRRAVDSKYFVVRTRRLLASLQYPRLFTSFAFACCATVFLAAPWAHADFPMPRPDDMPDDVPRDKAVFLQTNVSVTYYFDPMSHGCPRPTPLSSDSSVAWFYYYRTGAVVDTMGDGIHYTNALYTYEGGDACAWYDPETRRIFLHDDLYEAPSVPSIVVTNIYWQTSVLSGPDGICNSSWAGGDDVHVFNVGSGMPYQTCIEPCHQLTPKGGDDRKNPGSIDTGPNGVCESIATYPGDVQIIGWHQGLSHTVCVTAGANGYLDCANDVIELGNIGGRDDEIDLSSAKKYTVTFYDAGRRYSGYYCS